jgi:hypothetical protein
MTSWSKLNFELETGGIDDFKTREKRSLMGWKWE